MKKIKADDIIHFIQITGFVLISPLIILFWIAKIFGNFMVLGSDSALEIISNISNTLFHEDSNGAESK